MVAAAAAAGLVAVLDVNIQTRPRPHDNCSGDGNHRSGRGCCCLHVVGSAIVVEVVASAAKKTNRTTSSSNGRTRLRNESRANLPASRRNPHANFSSFGLPSRNAQRQNSSIQSLAMKVQDGPAGSQDFSVTSPQHEHHEVKQSLDHEIETSKMTEASWCRACPCFPAAWPRSC